MRSIRWRPTLAAVGLVLLLGACTVEKVDEAHVGVGYTDGWIEGKKFDGVIEPGGSRTVFNDHVYRLPTRQITYLTGEGGDAPSLVITAKGGERMIVDLAVRSFLNTRETTLEDFFLEICQKDRTLKRDGQSDKTIEGCWDDASEEGVAGWILMLDETFGNPAQAVANDVGLDFEAESLRYNNETKDTFSTAFATEFRRSQRRLIGNGEYFCGPGYDRDETDETADSWCPPLSVEVTKIRYESDALENVRSEQALAEEQEDLAVQEAATARAQQAAQNARATPQNLALMERQAMLDCAANPECQLSIVVNGSGEPLDATVPVG